jgi:hypothetical protein
MRPDQNLLIDYPNKKCRFSTETAFFVVHAERDEQYQCLFAGRIESPPDL